ncbi:MAG: hypothetical protein CVU47_10100 [Chloroflexi bacterium HGW-Chloroflexi-9]|nr:MAG: hypothetical protein CVU47_10100 [Chloroflexi bacterium HGW-Chloroflexi-9]
MTSDQDISIDGLISALRALETGTVPVLTATIDLGVGGDGRPVALRMLGQAVREAIDRGHPDPSHATRRSLDEDAAALEEAVERATAHGAAGLIYAGAAEDGVLFTLEAPVAPRNAVDIGERPALFEIVRTRYLSGRPAVLVSASLREVELSRVRYAVVEDTDAISPSSRLEKHQQRTKREGKGSIDGAGGHAMNRVEQQVEAHRAIFAADAAQEIAQFAAPGEMIILAGVDEARSAILGRLSEPLRAAVVEAPALDPTQDERSRSTHLTGLVVTEQQRLGDLAAAAWFSGEHGERAMGGIKAGLAACEQGRLGTLILHEDAVDHFGTAVDARSYSPEHDPIEIEALLLAALAQAAEVIITRDPRALEQHQGVLGIARY